MTDCCCPAGKTFYPGKEWTCRNCGATWKGTDDLRVVRVDGENDE